MKIFKKTVAAWALCSVATLGGVVPAAQASVSQPGVVSSDPADTTPHIVFTAPSQSVYAFAQVGRTMYAGGRFTQVQDPARTTTYERQNFVAFDSETGAVSPLNLSFDGLVGSIATSDDERALYISGGFHKVDGVAHRGLIKYDLVNNRIDPTFKPTAAARRVSAVKLVNGSLIVAGNFPKHLLALNPTTGADTGSIDLTVAGVVDPTEETSISRIAISPDGSRLVATGNFATVNGQIRKRAFEVNLGGTATLNTWHAPRFDVTCDSHSSLISAQGVDFSPDGTYFVIVATGGTGSRGVCDATARFETANVSGRAEPTWINHTGGDTLYSVAVTGAAVYVGGHQRWLDNPYGRDSAGPGAVSRPGIGAIDPVTGKALAWNPTKSRNHGTTALFATSRGLWVGSDGTRFGREDHAGIGFVPIDGLGPLDYPPVANGQSVSLHQGSTTSVILTGSDPDNDPLRFKVTSLPANGKLYDGNGEAGHLIAAGELPYALTGAGDAATYQPNTGHSGPDAFQFKANDGQIDSTAAATVSITVNQPNQAPVANDDSATTPLATPVTVNVLANDSDPDNDPLAVTGASTPVHGTAVVNGDTTIGYVPDLDYTGPDTFNYSVSDGNGATASATVSITVSSASTNLIGNSGFELDTSGWQTEASSNTLSRIAGGHSGGWAAQLSNTLAAGRCELDDKPSWVSVTQDGAYAASIWVRSDTPGLTFKVRVREYGSGMQQGSVSTSLTLTSSWQQVTVVYTPVAPGRSSLDFDAYTSNSPVGVCFQADDASITH